MRAGKSRNYKSVLPLVALIIYSQRLFYAIVCIGEKPSEMRSMWKGNAYAARRSRYN